MLTVITSRGVVVCYTCELIMLPVSN